MVIKIGNFRIGWTHTTSERVKRRRNQRSTRRLAKKVLRLWHYLDRKGYSPTDFFDPYVKSWLTENSKKYASDSKVVAINGVPVKEPKKREEGAS